MQGKLKDLTGQKFNKLTVIKRYGSQKTKNGSNAVWECICECGNISYVTTSNLNKTISCGCFHGPRQAWNRLPENESLVNTVYSNYKNRANKLNLEFLIDKEYFKELIFKNCFYCGVTPSQIIDYTHLRLRKNGCTLKYNGIDRKNSNIGYVKDNIVTCCKTCNYGKRNLTYEEWLDYLNNLVNYRNSL